MMHTFRIGLACVVFLSVTGITQALQKLPVTAPRPTSVSASAPATAPAVGAPATPAGATPAQLTSLAIAGGSNHEIDLTWSAPTEEGGTIKNYVIARCADVATNCEDVPAVPTDLTTKCMDGPQPVAPAPAPAATAAKSKFCRIGTSTTNSYSDYSLNNPPDPKHLDLNSSSAYTYYVYAVDANDKRSIPSKSLSVRTASAGKSCLFFPTRSGCMDFGVGADVNKNRETINSNINLFYQTAGSYTFFNQIKSIYNGASGSATVSADLATLNFGDGLQVIVATNAQAGSSGTTTASTTAVPRLAANGAGQATQNVIYGGTFAVSEIYPLLSAGFSKWGTAGGFGVFIDAIAKEGADVQNFKSGSNVNISSPPFHGSAQLEGYLQYNSINLIPKSQNFTGSLFIGGSYGYDYMSHGYARDYGFGTALANNVFKTQVNNGIGLVQLGIVINTVAKITVSRAFGPSQTYIDSTTGVQTTKNNFRAWSFGVTYQSAPPTK